MLAVLDTNIVVSGLLWRGPPHQLIALAARGRLTLCSSKQLLDELTDVLHRPKHSRAFRLAGLTPALAVAQYRLLVRIVTPDPIPPVILEDPPDDAVLACALAAAAETIVSGDRHLLSLRQYKGIPIVTAAGLLAQTPS